MKVWVNPEGSNYQTTVEILACKYFTDARPFGSFKVLGVAEQ